MDRVDIRVLGPLEVLVDDAPVGLGPPRARLVLAQLLAAPARAVRRDVLIDRIWPDGDPARARHSLNVAVATLRRRLDEVPGLEIETTDHGYRLLVPPDAVDADRFEDLSETDPLEASALWRGPAFDGMADHPGVVEAAAALEESRLSVTIRRIETDIDIGAAAPAIAELDRLMAEHPYNERLCGLLMKALYRAGRASDALAAYRRFRTLLGDDLGIEPGPDLARIEEQILLHDPRLHPAGGLRPIRILPAERTDTVGRTAELASIIDRLEGNTLITLVGAAGTGKTRLALLVAHRLAPQQPVWFVELGQLTEPDRVPDVLAAALGLNDLPGESPLEAVVGELRARPASLLVLDNCEHLVHDVAHLAERLTFEVPGVRILCTSREPLGVSGESIWPVDPLPVPPPGADDEEIARADAVTLFVARARTASPAFDPGAGLRQVAEICRRLDGLPLAIELAAARVPGLGIEEIAAGLADRFRLLSRGPRTAAPRHRTMRAAIEWSNRLLTEDERIVLRRAAVFAGTFGLDAARTVIGFPPIDAEDVADLLTRLVERSLLRADGSEGRVAFRMLETIREFALGGLIDGGEHDDVIERFLAHYVDVAPQIERDGLGSRWSQAMVWLDREFDNVTDVSNRLEDRGEGVRSLVLTASLARLVTSNGRYRLIADRIARAETLADDAGIDPALRAKTQLILAVGAGFLPLADCVANGRAAHDHYRSAGNHAGAGWAAFCLATTYSAVGELALSARWAAKAADHASRSGWDVQRAWLVPGHVVFRHIEALLGGGAPPDPMETRRVLAEAERIADSVGNPELATVVRASSATSSLLLGDAVRLAEVPTPGWLEESPSPLSAGFHLMRTTVALAAGDADEAEAALLRALASVRIGRLGWVAWSYAEFLAEIAVLRDDWEGAARLLASHEVDRHVAFGYGAFFHDFSGTRRTVEKAVGADRIDALRTTVAPYGPVAAIDRYLARS